MSQILKVMHCSESVGTSYSFMLISQELLTVGMLNCPSARSVAVCSCAPARLMMSLWIHTQRGQNDKKKNIKGQTVGLTKRTCPCLNCSPSELPTCPVCELDGQWECVDHMTLQKSDPMLCTYRNKSVTYDYYLIWGEGILPFRKTFAIINYI